MGEFVHVLCVHLFRVLLCLSLFQQFAPHHVNKEDKVKQLTEKINELVDQVNICLDQKCQKFNLSYSDQKLQTSVIGQT